MIEADLIRAYFGDLDPPPVLRVGLARGGVEITSAGYERRLVSRGRWSIDGSIARSTVVFGPFDEATSFDSALILRGDVIVEVLPFDDPVSLARGMGFQHEAVISATRKA